MEITEMQPTKMAVIDVSRTCNVRCTCCYYRYETWDCKDESKKQNWIKSCKQLKLEIANAVMRGCDRVDFTGGEPTIHPDMVEVLEYCKQRGLEPRIITNGQAQSNRMYELIGAGCKDWLLSIHDIDENLSKIMQSPNAWRNMLRTIEIIKERKCKFATNTVIMKENFERLPIIAKFIATSGAYLANFINCNPMYQATMEEYGVIHAKVSETAKFIIEAIDVLKERDIWANVRYYPMCQLPKEYRKHICNHPQVMFDWRNEWDYGVFPKDKVTYLKHGREAFQYKSDKQDGECGKCGIRNVCGGVNNGYFASQGESELVPQEEKSDYPFFYRAVQDEVDILIPAYTIIPNLNKLLVEIIHKTIPPYNLILTHKEQSAAKNRNYGLKRSKSPFIIMCDDDIGELPMGWNKLLVNELLYNPEVTAVSARLMDTDGKPGLNSANNFDMESEEVEVNMIPTACCAFRNPAKYGIELDERFMKSGWEDTDLFKKLLKVRPGKILITNKCKVTHLNNATGYNEWFHYNKQIYEENENERRNTDTSKAVS